MELLGMAPASANSREGPLGHRGTRSACTTAARLGNDRASARRLGIASCVVSWGGSALEAAPRSRGGRTMPRSWEGPAGHSRGALRAHEERQGPAGLHPLGSRSSWLSRPPSCRAVECGWLPQQVGRAWGAADPTAPS